jgi:hypothetical protein
MMVRYLLDTRTAHLYLPNAGLSAVLFKSQKGEAICTLT